MRGRWRVLNSCQLTELRVLVSLCKQTFRGLNKGARFERFELFIGNGFGKRKKNGIILTFCFTILSVDYIEMLLKMYIFYNKMVKRAHISYTT